MPQPSSSNQMWLACIHLVLTGSTVLVVSTIAFFTRAPSLFIPNLICLMVLICVFIFIFLKRNSASDNVPAWAFLFVTSILVGLVAINHEYFFRQVMLFQPYVGIKLLAIAIALIAPPKRWVGWSALALAGVAPAIQCFFLLNDHSKLGIQEPYITFIFIITAGFLYYNRLKVFQVLQKNEEALALGRYGQLMLGAQHLQNSPLQAIEFSMSLISKDDPNSQVAVESIQKSLTSVRHLNKLLSFAESNVRWGNLRLPADIDEFESELNELKKRMQI